MVYYVSDLEVKVDIDTCMSISNQDKMLYNIEMSIPVLQDSFCISVERERRQVLFGIVLYSIYIEMQGHLVVDVFLLSFRSMGCFGTYC